MLTILDYKAGNQTSVQRAFHSIGVETVISADPACIEKSDGLIFPGVGAAGQAMGLLQQSGLEASMRRVIEKGTPLLGICLGCQILLEYSEEGPTQTLGVLPGYAARFTPELTDQGKAIRIPHMGWNTLSFHTPDDPLFKGLSEKDSFYFVHSFYPKPAPELCLATCTYGLPFAAVFGRKGLWAVQFHPEKSGQPGLKLLANFAAYCGLQTNAQTEGAC